MCHAPIREIKGYDMLLPKTPFPVLIHNPPVWIHHVLLGPETPMEELDGVVS